MFHQTMFFCSRLHRCVHITPRALLFEAWLALHLGFFFLCAKAFSRIIFSVIFRASNHQLVDKRIKTEMFFKLPNLNSNLALTLGYLNPTLNNSAQETFVWQKLLFCHLPAISSLPLLHIVITSQLKSKINLTFTVFACNIHSKGPLRKHGLF